MITAQNLDTILTEDYQRQTQVFVSEAIKEWDNEGEGDFGQWIARAVLVKWISLARKN